MAQQVERFTRNEQVGGSNPPTSSKRPKRDKRSGLFRCCFLIYKLAHNARFYVRIKRIYNFRLQRSFCTAHRLIPAAILQRIF